MESKPTCFIGVASGQRGVPFDLDGLLKGNQNQILSSFPKTFQYYYHFFDEKDFESALLTTSLRSIGEKSTFLLVSGYSKEKTLQLMQESKFNQCIHGAHDAKNRIYIINPNYNHNL